MSGLQKTPPAFPRPLFPFPLHLHPARLAKKAPLMWLPGGPRDDCGPAPHQPINRTSCRPEQALSWRVPRRVQVGGGRAGAHRLWKWAPGRQAHAHP